MSEEIDNLFQKAIELDESVREAFLAGLPGNQRAEVGALLAADAYAQHADFMDPESTLIQKLEIDEAFTQIGPYKILQRIGYGGMGYVFMAEQTEPVRRRVALKIIKTETPSKEILARFEAERQALAMMDHQNIARVLDAGITESGLPYFAMELVKGVPITNYSDKNKLTPNERLELFVQTCRAIQHAHMKGIVHRDIKPSNVLVTLYDGKPVAKVIDFGLAKALQDTIQLTNRTLFTQFGQVVGTLAYMSPEQAEMNALDVDTRTDVYSLGVVLYELLTGSTPITRERIRSEAFDRILGLIREEEAVRPSQRLSDSGDQIAGISDQRKTEPRRLSLILKGDLDWIVVKALEKDRTRRYDTPASLADDVQRYLHEEAIEARPPSIEYRLRKTLGKHKGKFIAGVSVLGLLIVGLIVTGTMWFRASEAEFNAKISESKAISEARKARDAEGKERLARTAVQQERDNAQATLSRSNYLLAIARWNSGRVKEARELLYKVLSPHRHLEWNLTMRQFRGGDWACFGHQLGVESVSFSPDGRWIVSGSDDMTIRLWDASTGEELRVLEGHTSRVSSVSFSPDGRWIVSGSDDTTIRLWDGATGEELRTLERHTSRVTSVCFSPDGSRIVSGSDDKTIRLWDGATGEELRVLNGHKEEVTSVSFSPDGRWIASGSGHRTIRLWDASTGEELRVLNGHTKKVTSVTFSPDGTRIASGSRDKTIRLWDASTGEQLRVLNGHTEEVTSVIFSPDGRWIASGSDDRTIRLWDAPTGEQLRVLNGHTKKVTSVSFSADGTRLVSGSDDLTLRLWDVSTGEDHRTLKGHRSIVESVSFSPDGTQIASGSDDRTIRLWDASTGEQIRVLNGHTSGVSSVSFSPDGTQIASGSDDKAIRLWDASAGEELRVLEGHTSRVSSVSFSPDGRWIVSGSDDTTIRLWDGATGEELRTLEGHTSRVTSVCFSPDGSRIASGSGDRTIRLWVASTGEELTTLERYTGPVASVSFSPDGRWIASGDDNNTIHLWDASTGDQLRVLNGHTKAVTSVSFSADGTRLVSGSRDRTIRLWDASTGEELRILYGHTIWVASVSFSPNSMQIASAGYGETVRLWDASPDEELRVLKGHEAFVYGLSFSPDGARIASGSRDKTIRLWDASTSKELKVMEGHSDMVTGLSFSPDGARIASGSRDKTIRLWDASTGKELRVMEGHSDAVTDVIFSPDGTRIASGSVDKSIRLWDASSGEELSVFMGHTGAVLNSVNPGSLASLGFSPDGTRLYSVAGTEKFVWRVSTGQIVPGAEWIALDNRTRHGRWLAVHSGESILLVDTEFKNTPREKKFRAMKAKPKLSWHREQLPTAQQGQHWYAATFHAASWLQHQPESRAAYEELNFSWQRLDSVQKELVPEVVKVATRLPKPSVPELTLGHAQEVSDMIWKKFVMAPNATPNMGAVEWMQAVVRDYPKRAYFIRVLGCTQYRAGNYKKAIDACLKSAELTLTGLNRSASYAGDFAFLAMSHFQLNNLETANQYRMKLDAAMKLEAFKDDQECLSFVEEVEALFDGVKVETADEGSALTKEGQ